MNVDRIGVVMATEVNADGWVGIQVEPFGGAAGSSPFSETIHPNGFLSRPVDPETDDEGRPTAGTTALVVSEGDETFALPLSDIRQIKDLVALNKGDAVAYAPGGAVFTKWAASGSVSHFCTTDNTYTGRSVYARQAGTGWDWSHPTGRMQFGEVGFHVTLGAGAGINLSAIGAPSPLDALGTSILTLQADFIHLNARAISLGNDGGATAFAALSTLCATLGQIVQAISLITTATPGAAALASALLPPNGAAAIPVFQLALNDLGKVV